MKKTLTHVTGVSNVTVSFKDKSAVIVFDNAKTSVNDLTTAATNSGISSQLRVD